MDANYNVQDGEVTKTLMEVDIFEAVVSNHGGESVPATCATNKQQATETNRQHLDLSWADRAQMWLPSLPRSLRLSVRPSTHLG